MTRETTPVRDWLAAAERDAAITGRPLDAPDDTPSEAELAQDDADLERDRMAA